ncbi:pilus assembly protein TadB [Photobacterium rosenbergii]|uniref:Pilus assembly protein TadB n=2 Tax=Photobacterium rosenbergii TaxID=294936 RepID=A0A2T3NK17_9GAMM|nr:pilus assembly protein TadB [Photobacterium rosenbergii]
MDQNLQLYLIILFVAVVVISQTILISATGTRANRNRLLKKQLEVIAESGKVQQQSLLRKSYLDKLSPTERWLENNSVGEYLSDKLSRAGLEWKAYKVVFWLLISIITSMIFILFMTLSIKAMFLTPIIVIGAFYIFIQQKTEKRLQLFEEQFVEALDVMKRALLVGYPFTEVMKSVSEEMPPPISVEFGKTFVELNYGVDLKVALANLAQRNPSVSVLAFNSAVTIQKETGGNLAETLDKISNVIRSRFRLMRKVKTLSAEGRMSAWVLMMVPFVLFLMLYLSNPHYISPLLESERGQSLLSVTAFLMTAGLLWIRKLLRIEV